MNYKNKLAFVSLRHHLCNMMFFCILRVCVGVCVWVCVRVYASYASIVIKCAIKAVAAIQTYQCVES